MLSVYNYKDPVSFISGYIDYKKSQSENFSIRKWSSSLGLSSSAPILDILKGKKKLKGKLLEVMMNELPIDKSEMMYFQAINERAHVKNSEKALMYDLLIKDLSPGKEENYSCYRVDENLDLYSHWIYMAILSIAALEDFEFSIENIREALRENIDLEIIEKATFDLFSFGLLKREEDGKVIRVHRSYCNKTDNKVKNLESYLEMLCDLAKKSASMSLDERELQCFSFAMSKENMPLAKEILRKARKQIVSLSEEGKKDTVYQANLIMFPLAD